MNADKNKTSKQKKGKGWHEKRKVILTKKGVETKAPRHYEVSKKDEYTNTLRTPMVEEPEPEIIGRLKPKSKEFVEAFNRILRTDSIKSIDQDPFQVMGDSPAKGWRKVNADILLLHGDVLRSTDGKQIAITTWTEDDAGTDIFEISPKIPDKEIPALLKAYFDYMGENAPVGRYEELETVMPGVTVEPLELRGAELQEDGAIVRKIKGYKYRVSFKHIQVWDRFDSRDAAMTHINNTVSRIVAAAKRVLNQQFKDFNSEEEAKAFFKDKKIIDYIPFRIKKKNYHIEEWWLYFEGHEGIFDLNWSSTLKHEISEWVAFWANQPGKYHE